MSQLPTFADASETAQQAADAVSQRGRVLLPWLPDPFTCPACGSMCYASATFAPTQAMYVTSWECRECEQHYHRDPAYGSDILEGPTEGSQTIRELLSK